MCYYCYYCYYRREEREREIDRHPLASHAGFKARHFSSFLFLFAPFFLIPPSSTETGSRGRAGGADDRALSKLSPL